MGERTRLARNMTALLEELFPHEKFQLTFYEQQPQHFGNEIFEYEFADFLLFVVKDRGEISVDLAAKDLPDKHVPLPDLLRSIGSAGAELSEQTFDSAHRQLELLSQHRSEILRALRE